jgi:DNA-binding GntR family transcriptional regulator
MSTDLRIVAMSAPLRREIEARLRVAIVEGHFKPGERLVEREMCKRLGVSRASLREALRQLEAEQLVTLVPHRGPAVAEIRVEEARALYDVRAVLEGLAARRFAESASDDDIALLRKAVDGFAEVVSGNSDQSPISAKAEIYKVLLDRCGNEVARRILIQLNNRVSVLRATSMSQKGRVHKSLSEISKIVDAIERRDADGAWAASIEHVEEAAKAALSVLHQQQESRIT